MNDWAGSRFFPTPHRILWPRFRVAMARPIRPKFHTPNLHTNAGRITERRHVQSFGTAILGLAGWLLLTPGSGTVQRLGGERRRECYDRPAIGAGVDGQSRSFDVMEISRPEGLALSPTRG